MSLSRLEPGRAGPGRPRRHNGQSRYLHRPINQASRPSVSSSIIRPAKPRVGWLGGKEEAARRGSKKEAETIRAKSPLEKCHRGIWRAGRLVFQEGEEKKIGPPNIRPHFFPLLSLPPLSLSLSPRRPLDIVFSRIVSALLFKNKEKNKEKDYLQLHKFRVRNIFL